MSHHKAIEKKAINAFPEDLDGLNILEIGFGYGFWGLMLRVRRKGDFTLTGVDIFKPYVEKQRRLNLYNEVHNADGRDLPFPDNSFDIVYAFEVLEHLEEPDGHKLISEMERVSKGKVMLTTPVGFALVKRIIDENENNLHRSGWSPERLREIGYSVSVIPLRNYSKIVKQILRIKKILNIPGVSHEMLAEKWLQM